MKFISVKVKKHFLTSSNPLWVLFIRIDPIFTVDHHRLDRSAVGQLGCVAVSW